jgi:NADP-dependent 3-hydroxy acid dehydrogenase YdfG
LAVTEALAAYGFSVAVLGRSGAAAAERLAAAGLTTERVTAWQGDLRDESQVVSGVAAVVERLGRLDAVVNNAGVSPVRDSGLEATTSAEWRSMIEVNLSGLYYVCRETLPHLMSADNGYLINILSLAAHRAKAGGAIYSASKYGARALTESLAAQTAQTSVRVSAICPGPTDTGAWDLRDQPPSAAARSHMLRPASVAQAVLWLLRQPADVYIPEIRIEPRPSNAAASGG